MTQFGGAGGSFGPNAWLVDDMYDRFLADPDSVSDSWREFFADYRPAPVPAPAPQSQAPSPAPTREPPTREPQGGAARAGGARGGRPPPRRAPGRVGQGTRRLPRCAARPRGSWRTWRPACPCRRPPA